MWIILTNILGAGIGVFIAFLFFETFMSIKQLKKHKAIIGIAFIIALNMVCTWVLQNMVFLPLVTIAMVFLLSLFFSSSLTYKILLTFAVSAIMFAAEQLVGIVFTRVLGITINQIQNNATTYLVGVLVSRLLPMLIVYVIRLFMRNNKQEADKRFNLLMACMPIQSIILCFIVYGYYVEIDLLKTPAFGIVAILVSLFLVFVIMLVLNNQRKALIYKKEYDIANTRLHMQIEHYQKLYQTQHEIRSIRHDMSNNLIALSGMLAKGAMPDAIGHIDRIISDIKKTEDIVDTGFPAIDAIFAAKLNKAKESNICLEYKILLDDEMNIDQFDLAVLIANALDNCIEGILRSSNVDRRVLLHIAREAEFVSLFAENDATGLVFEDFRTSKPEKHNHGFGLAQMRSIAQKYCGDIQPGYNPDTCKFSLKVLLKNQTP